MSKGDDALPLFVAAGRPGYHEAVRNVRLSKTASLHFLLPAVVALLAGALTFCEIDPAGSYPGMPQGPGLTTDEAFNVQEGVRLVAAGPELLAGRLTLRQVFGGRGDLEGQPAFGFHLPDHPPLGRLWIGMAHRVTRALFPPDNHESPFATACARTAPAAAFMVTIFLVGWAAANWYGWPAGLIASLSLVLMPRVFGHAHLAALETLIGLAYAAAVLSVAQYWRGPNAPGWKAACLTGGVFGLALLTKIQAVLLPLPVCLWALWQWRQRAIRPLALWSLTAFVVFFVGWPWLWLDPVDHLLEYFGRTADRARLYTFYFGTKYADTEVPWHYPFVMFLVTVPVGLQLLGACGLIRSFLSNSRREDSSPSAGVRGGDATRGFSEKAGCVRKGHLTAACVVFPLIVFCLPGIAVYDGARLFLVAFPLWAIFVGRGGVVVYDYVKRRLGARGAAALLSLLIVLQGYGLVALRPCYLSYYNLLVGGLPGAQRLGLEMNYWGDGITRDLLRQTARLVPQSEAVGFLPVVYELAPDEFERQSPILRKHEIELVPWRAEGRGPRYLLLFRRRADLPPSLQRLPDEKTMLAATTRQGVVLAALYEMRAAAKRGGSTHGQF